jgi:hypothetical protein
MRVSSGTESSVLDGVLVEKTRDIYRGGTPERESQVCTVLVTCSNPERGGAMMWRDLHKRGVESARSRHARHIVHSMRGDSATLIT